MTSSIYLFNQLYLDMTRRAGGDPFTALMATLGDGAAQLIAHPLEYGSMFQDRAGTTPVTESGQLVGHCLDAGSGGYHATAVSDAARGIFRDVGGKRWIEYNGVNTAYQTPVLPAPGVDKAQVFSGLRKLTDAATGMLVELSPRAPNNDGTLYITAPELNSEGYRALSKGTTFTTADASIVDFPAPLTSVISFLGDILGDLATLRIDGTQVDQATGDQGTGNYLSYPLYYGARAGTSLFLNGYHYRTLGPIVRFGTNATPEQIAAAEAYYQAGLPT